MRAAKILSGFFFAMIFVVVFGFGWAEGRDRRTSLCSAQWETLL